MCVGFRREVWQCLLNEHGSLQVLQRYPQLPNPTALREKLHLLPVVAGDVIVCHGLGLVAHLADDLALLKHLEGLSIPLGL